MPFQKRAKITVESQHKNPVPAFFYQIDYCLRELPENAGYFHAQWRRQRLTEKGKDYVVLDNVHGRGQYIGTYLALTTLERYWWGEGEIEVLHRRGQGLSHHLRQPAPRTTSAAPGALPSR